MFTHMAIFGAAATPICAAVMEMVSVAVHPLPATSETVMRRR